jgi:hypothetical protein
MPDGFVAAVLSRTTERASLRQRIVSAIWAPHVLQWNLAGAASAASMIVLIGGGLAISSREPAPASTVAAAPASSSTPARVLVRLVVVHPGARTVQAAGDFNGWNPQATPLEPVSNGAWTVTIPLEPGRYGYQFVVDGEQWIADPFAVEHNDDGFGSRNAVLDVRPAGAAL